MDLFSSFFLLFICIVVRKMALLVYMLFCGLVLMCVHVYLCSMAQSVGNVARAILDHLSVSVANGEAYSSTNWILQLD